MTRRHDSRAQRLSAPGNIIPAHRWVARSYGPAETKLSISMEFGDATTSLFVHGGSPGAALFILIGTEPANLPFLGNKTVLVHASASVLAVRLDQTGSYSAPVNLEPLARPGWTFYMQALAVPPDCISAQCVQLSGGLELGFARVQHG